MDEKQKLLNLTLKLIDKNIQLEKFTKIIESLNRNDPPLFEKISNILDLLLSENLPIKKLNNILGLLFSKDLTTGEFETILDLINDVILLGKHDEILLLLNSSSSTLY